MVQAQAERLPDNDDDDDNEAVRTKQMKELGPYLLVLNKLTNCQFVFNV